MSRLADVVKSFASKDKVKAALFRLAKGTVSRETEREAREKGTP